MAELTAEERADWEQALAEADHVDLMHEAERYSPQPERVWPELRRRILRDGGIAAGPYTRHWIPGGLYRVKGEAPDVIARELADEGWGQWEDADGMLAELQRLHQQWKAANAARARRSRPANNAADIAVDVVPKPAAEVADPEPEQVEAAPVAERVAARWGARTVRSRRRHRPSVRGPERPRRVSLADLDYFEMQRLSAEMERRAAEIERRAAAVARREAEAEQRAAAVERREADLRRREAAISRPEPDRRPDRRIRQYVADRREIVGALTLVGAAAAGIAVGVVMSPAAWVGLLLLTPSAIAAGIAARTTSPAPARSIDRVPMTGHTSRAAHRPAPTRSNTTRR